MTAEANGKENCEHTVCVWHLNTKIQKNSIGVIKKRGELKEQTTVIRLVSNIHFLEEERTQYSNRQNVRYAHQIKSGDKSTADKLMKS